MTDTPEKSTEESKPKRRNTEKTVGVVVGIVAVVAVLFVVGMNAGWLTASPRESDNGQAEEPVPIEVVPPQIVNLTSTLEQVSPGGTSDFTCEVEHPSPDELTYTWSPTGGEIRGGGAEVEWIAPDAEGLFRVFVTVSDDHGNADEKSYAIRVRVNRPPEIMAMDSRIDSAGWVLPGASVVVWCEAEDPDRDALTYEWVATEGETFGQGNSIAWVAPNEIGTYWITVYVSDPHGGEARRAIPITVSAARPPEIVGFSVTPVGHSYLMEWGDGWRIFISRSCVIEAIVDDDSPGYTYEWSASRGTLTPHGASAEWQAPSTRGPVTIVLEVSDAYDNTTSASVHMDVTDCALCFS